MGDTACSEKILSTPEVYFAGFGCHLARRVARIASISAGVFSSPFTPTIASTRAGISMRIRSPSSTSAIGPPLAASGETWPMAGPVDAPEKRPSVIRAIERPSSLSDEIASVGVEHLRHAGALRALVADEHRVAGLDFVGQIPRRSPLPRCRMGGRAERRLEHLLGAGAYA